MEKQDEGRAQVSDKSYNPGVTPSCRSCQKYADVYAHRCTHSVKQASDFCPAAFTHWCHDASCEIQRSLHASFLFHLLEPAVRQSLQVDAEPGAGCPLSVWVEVMQGEC